MYAGTGFDATFAIAPEQAWLTDSALAQARAIRERRLSSRELVQAYLTRIERLNPLLNAFVEVAPQRALLAAAVKDAEARSRRQLPAFHGVPIGIKDLGFVRGLHTRLGARSWKRVWAPIDDLTVRALKRAGFIIVGKLATSEVGAMPVTEPDIHPPTRNPWNLSHSAGGSSGGSAAAVAAGLLPLAHGSDGGGSIRIPAAFCNVFGFKPSRGRVRNPYGSDHARLLYTCGPIARCVDDAAALLDAMNNAAHPEVSFAQAARADVPKLRVRYALRSPLCAAEPDQVEATQRVLQLLEQFGHSVELGPDVAGELDDFLPLWQALVATAPLLRAKMQPVTRWLAESGKRYDKRFLRERHDRVARLVDDMFGDTDIWVTPTVAVSAPRIGAYAGQPPEAAFREAAKLGGFTAPFNVTGQPAASLPVGFGRDGLPVGVQLVGRRMQDGLVLSVARQLEVALRTRASLAST